MGKDWDMSDLPEDTDHPEFEEEDTYDEVPEGVLPDYDAEETEEEDDA